MLYSIFYIFVWLITLFPLRILYLFSDILYPIVYYVVRYRKEVVRTNLLKSFPDKTEKERLQIERRFYRFFCDLFIETVKEIHLSEAEMKRRMSFVNIEALLEQYAKGKSVMLMTAHYGNWEWAAAIAIFFPRESPVYNIYKKLKNKKIDIIIYSIRSKFGGKNIEKHELLRKMIRLKNDSKLGVFGMISDQTPNIISTHYWTHFLNQDTAMVIGTEQLARKFDYPVFYLHIDRIKRGFYRCECIPISLEPTQTSVYEITETYTRILEKKIETAPEYWLWSHRRWKHRRN